MSVCMSVHLAAMEGHSECVRYLVQQLLDQLAVPCPTPQTTQSHPVLTVANNLGETPKLLAERFLKYETVEMIDSLLEPSTASPDDIGIH